MTSDTDSSATLTVRLIRSFTHRNIQHVVYKNVDLRQSGHEFVATVLADLPNRSSLPLPFRKFVFDAMKIEHKAHKSKTSDPVINTEHDDELMINLDKSLQECGVEDETEVSCFILKEYKAYQLNPVTEFR